MTDLKPLAVFAEVVNAGSMSGAARRLGMSASAVSQTIRALEAAGGVMLLHRSTRKLALTEAGERYYPHCKRLLEAAQAAADTLQQMREQPVGELRVSAPAGFAQHMAPAFAPLLAEAPQLRMRLLLDDALIDLIDARIDIAVRVGRLPDSDWVARRLCELETMLFASPQYLLRHGTPANPDDLASHQWLAQGSDTTELALRQGDAHHALKVTARVASNSQVALQHLCEQGLGIARLARADVMPSLREGRLVPVLPAWKPAALPVWATTPGRDADPAKTRAALAALRAYFAALPGIDLDGTAEAPES